LHEEDGLRRKVRQPLGPSAALQRVLQGIEWMGARYQVEPFKSSKYLLNYLLQLGAASFWCSRFLVHAACTKPEVPPLKPGR
jgi:hypothetical protein